MQGKNPDYEDAIEKLEQLARDADNDDDFFVGFPAGFDDCDANSGIVPNSSNYRGNFVGRGLSAAFFVHDRFLNVDPFIQYDPPSDIVVSPL